MIARSRRIPVVFDTTVFVRNFKGRGKTTSYRRVIRLWLLERRLQLIASPEIVAEYLEIFEEVLGFDRSLLEQWQLRFREDQRTTMVRLARRYGESWDQDDNVLLAAALAGHAEYLISNDLDLLDLPFDFQRTLPFLIRTPRQLLVEFPSM